MTKGNGEYLELVGRGQLVGGDAFAERRDGIARLAHLLDLVARTVGRAGVRHGVARIAVRGHLHHHRSLSRGAMVNGETRGFAHRQDVHAVHLERGWIIRTVFFSVLPHHCDLESSPSHLIELD